VTLLFPSLHGYRREWLRGDLIAGLTVWAVLVPEALAYASIAGVSPVVGLYAAPGALLLYAAFGSSRHLVTGSDVRHRGAVRRDRRHVRHRWQRRVHER
jgi:SulP family sulfate permease